MNNPGIDVTVWERLRENWSELQSAGNKLKISFHLIKESEHENNILAIDVVQNINDEVITETVQRNADEAYPILGIAGLSMERLVEVYKEKMYQLYRQSKFQEANFIVTMTISSPISGEVRAFIENPGSSIKSNLQVNYQHYYILSALREKMIELTGDEWHTVRAVYRPRALEFYFEY